MRECTDETAVELPTIRYLSCNAAEVEMTGVHRDYPQVLVSTWHEVIVGYHCFGIIFFTNMEGESHLHLCCWRWLGASVCKYTDE